MTFDEVWAFTDAIPGSFTRLSGEKLYDAAMRVPPCGIIVEVGVDQGRSASILLHTAQITGTHLIFVDSWESILVDNKYKFQRMVKEFRGVSTVVCHGRSVDIVNHVAKPIDLIHIDANHYEGGIDMDCESWLPKVRSGGVAAFHDFGASFPAVTDSVNKYTAGWEHLGNWDGLAIRRKV